VQNGVRVIYPVILTQSSKKWISGLYQNAQFSAAPPVCSVALFPLPFFPVAFFSDCLIFRCRFFSGCPIFRCLLFRLPNFPLPFFSGCPIFRLPNFPLPFFPLPFLPRIARAKRQHRAPASCRQSTHMPVVRLDVLRRRRRHRRVYTECPMCI